VTRSTVLVLQN